LHDLREEVKNDEMVDSFAKDWRTAGLPEHTQTTLAFAEKLTLTPNQMGQEDIKSLRQQGYTDEDIHDITQIVYPNCGLFQLPYPHCRWIGNPSRRRADGPLAPRGWPVG
jgi:hypothetical protein